MASWDGFFHAVLRCFRLWSRCTLLGSVTSSEKAAYQDRIVRARSRPLARETSLTCYLQVLLCCHRARPLDERCAVEMAETTNLVTPKAAGGHAPTREGNAAAMPLFASSPDPSTATARRAIPSRRPRRSTRAGPATDAAHTYHA